MGLLAVAEFESLTGLVEDRKVNTFAWLGGNGFTAVGWEAVADAVIAFYNDVLGANIADVANRLSPDISRAANASSVSIYTIEGAQFTPVPGDASTFLGSPALVKQFTLDPSADGQGMPAEVALKVRWEAAGRADAPVETADGVDPGGEVDRPKQRHTCGIFLGPLTVSFNNLTPPSRPEEAELAEIAEAARAYADQLVAEGVVDAVPGCWSRSDGIIRSLEAVAVDNAFDTIRKRGPGPTSVTRHAVQFT